VVSGNPSSMNKIKGSGSDLTYVLGNTPFGSSSNPHGSGTHPFDMGFDFASDRGFPPRRMS